MTYKVPLIEEDKKVLKKKAALVIGGLLCQKFCKSIIRTKKEG